MTGSSSASGGTIPDACVRRAGMLNLAIYDTPRGSLPADLQNWHDINNRDWEMAWQIPPNPGPNDDFMARLYTPRGGPGDDPLVLCPPVLVFRGSDADEQDFAELAFAIRFSGTVEIDKPFPFGIGDETITLPPTDTTFSSNPEYNGKSMKHMRTLDMTEEVLFSGEAGTEVINIDVTMWPDAEVRLNWRFDASLFFRPQGDWAVDFAQGLGQRTAQYDRAINEAAMRAANTATNEWGERLVITGHSLGGGLASAAAIKIKRDFPAINMRVDTFNSAGLHANTARQAGGTLSTAGEVPVNARHVKDEILSAMQANSLMVPLLSALLAWGGKSLPPAVTTPIPGAGISPGPMAVGALTMDYGAAYQRLPTLYPLARQSISPGETTSVIEDITGLANSAASLSDFIAAVVRYLVGRLSAGNGLTQEEAEALPGISDEFPALSRLGRDFLAAMPRDAPIPEYDLGDSTYINTIVEPFLNALLHDLVMLARIIVASGMYHTFPPCAYTFLRPASN